MEHEHREKHVFVVINMDQSLGWMRYKDIISVTVLMVLSLRNAPEDRKTQLLRDQWVSVS